MDAKELHDQHEIQTLLDAIRSGLRPNWGDPIQVGIIERALSLLAAVESSGDEIVRELGALSDYLFPSAGTTLCKKAAARITQDAQEKAALNRHISALREALYGVTEDRSAIKAELAEVTKGYNTLALMFQEKRNENTLQGRALAAREAELAAMKSEADLFAAIAAKGKD